MKADPQVGSAAPLLKALKAVLSSSSPDRDEEMCDIAFGLAYPRRIAIAQALLASPQTEADLCVALDLSGFAVFSHLRILKKSGFVRQNGKHLQFVPPVHPLSKVLTQLLPSG